MVGEPSNANGPPVRTKEDLEREKLRLEINELQKHWWQKPSYVLAALPTFLALASIIYGFSNGYFQAMSIKLQNEQYELEKRKEKLQADVTQFTQEKDRLELENKKLLGQYQTIEALQNQVKYLNSRLKQTETGSAKKP